VDDVVVPEPETGHRLGVAEHPGLTGQVLQRLSVGRAAYRRVDAGTAEQFLGRIASARPSGFAGTRGP
jgi:hypothetical protein